VTRKTSHAVVDRASATELLCARQGLVLEAVYENADADADRGTGSGEAGDGLPPGSGSLSISRSFGQAEGPLASYRRTVSVTPADAGRYLADQVVELRAGLPWWSWLVVLPLRASLGRLGPAGRLGPGDPATAKMPWWAPPQRLDRRSALVACTLAAIVAVQGFVAGVLPETLTYAASEMHAGTFGQGAVFAAVELSALPALAALVRADSRGRRSVVLWATGGAVLFNELGALAPSVLWLTATQVAAGTLVAAGGIAAIVVAVEEVPAGCRAWSVGVLGMAGGLGGGVPLALLPLAGLGAGGWRWLFALSFVCLPVVAISARQLPESRRWARAPAAEPGPAEPGPAEPPRGPEHPESSWRTGPHWLRSPAGRLALVCGGAFLFALFASPASQFQTQFLRHERHYSPLAISVLEQLAGTLGGLGVLVGGRLADTHGRRPVAIACVAAATVTTLASYLAHHWLMWASTTASQFFFYATAPALGVYGVELFATSTRARSAGLVAAAAAIGAVAGLLATGALDDTLGTLAPALGVLAVGPILLVVLLVVAYPESSGVALEELTASA
jgi:MFS family permease